MTQYTMKGDRLHINEKQSIEVMPYKNDKASYIFRERNTVTLEKHGNQPIQLGNRTEICQKIKKMIDPENVYKPNKVETDLKNIKITLQEHYETIILAQTEIEAEKEAQEKQERIKNLKLAHKKIKEVDHVLLWIGSVIDWLTAGEKNNILLAFLAYASQILLNEPISVVALGDAGSGKTHILKIAMSLIPSKKIVYEKKITEAALFRRSEKDPEFYSGKIVNYGDMGGNNDLTFAEESKDLMKELMTEGYLNKPLTVPDGEGGYIVKDLELEGRPALTYTTVPGYDFDEQEMSRSIFLTPRMDNKGCYETRSSYLELKGKSYKDFKKYEEESKLIKYMLENLCEQLADVTIINPYPQLLSKFLGDTKYYKRDFPKYNNLLKTITALGYSEDKVIEINEKKVIFVSLDDIQLFLSLIEMYALSINSNLTLKATEILTDLKVNLNKWCNSTNQEYDTSYLVNDVGITINDYCEKSHTGLNKRSVQRYFSELNKAGYIKPTGQVNRANIWSLVNDEEDKKKSLVNDIETIQISKDVAKVECPEAFNFLNKDCATDGLSAFNYSDKTTQPPW